MPFGDEFSTSVVALILTATAIANVADNAASSPIANIEVSLHTASPSSGNQTTSEAGYTSYARVPVTRTVSGYSGGAGDASNGSAVTFPTCTGGSSAVTHVGLGTAHTSTGVLMLSGALDFGITVTSGVTPQFAISALAVSIA